MQEQAVDPLSDAELSAMIAAGDFQKEPTLINKLNSDERRRFLRLQGTGEGRIGPTSASRERNRVDNSILGVPPELAVTAGLGAARAVGGAVADAGASLGSKVMAGARAVGSEIGVPLLKYEVIHGALRQAGVPPSIAGPLAMVAAGYRRSGNAPEPVAEPTPAAPATPDYPSAAEMSPLELTRHLKAQNAARAGTSGAPSAPSNPTPPSTGQTLRPVRGARAGAPTSASSASAPSESAGTSIQFTQEELRNAERWAAQGVHPDIIVQRILKSRELTGALRTPTPDEMRATINKRNETGKWPE